MDRQGGILVHVHQGVPTQGSGVATQPSQPGLQINKFYSFDS